MHQNIGGQHIDASVYRISEHIRTQYLNSRVGYIRGQHIIILPYRRSGYENIRDRNFGGKIILDVKVGCIGGRRISQP